MIDGHTEVAKENHISIAELKEAIDRKAVTRGVDKDHRPIRLTTYTTPQTIFITGGVITEQARQEPARVKKEIIHIIDSCGLRDIYPNDRENRWFSRTSEGLSPHISIQAIAREDEDTNGIRLVFQEGGAGYSTEAILSIHGDSASLAANKLVSGAISPMFAERLANPNEIDAFFKILQENLHRVR